MDINPHKIEEPNYVPIAEKAPKPWYVVLILALVVISSAYFFYTLWLNLSVMKNWPTVTYIDCLFYPLRKELVRQKQGIYLIDKADLQERLGNTLKRRPFFRRTGEKSSNLDRPAATRSSDSEAPPTSMREYYSGTDLNSQPTSRVT